MGRAHGARAPGPRHARAGEYSPGIGSAEIRYRWLPATPEGRAATAPAVAYPVQQWLARPSTPGPGSKWRCAPSGSQMLSWRASCTRPERIADAQLASVTHSVNRSTTAETPNLCILVRSAGSSTLAGSPYSGGTSAAGRLLRISLSVTLTRRAPAIGSARVGTWRRQARTHDRQCPGRHVAAPGAHPRSAVPGSARGGARPRVWPRDRQCPGRHVAAPGPGFGRAMGSARVGMTRRHVLPPDLLREQGAKPLPCLAQRAASRCRLVALGLMRGHDARRPQQQAHGGRVGRRQQAVREALDARR